MNYFRVSSKRVELSEQLNFPISDQLNRAIIAEDIERVRQLIQSGASVNHRSMPDHSYEPLPPLFWAIRNQNSDIVRLLIQAGVDLNLGDRYGNTPLFWAIQNRNLNIIHQLIGAGAHINQNNVFGHSPLHLAARMGSPEIVELLLRQGANVNAEDVQGHTPFLENIIYSGNFNIATLLINAGADVNLSDENDNTPLLLAISNMRKPIVEYLILNRERLNLDINKANSIGLTPLRHAIAIRTGSDIVRQLMLASAAAGQSDRTISAPIEMITAKKIQKKGYKKLSKYKS